MFTPCLSCFPYLFPIHVHRFLHKSDVFTFTFMLQPSASSIIGGTLVPSGRVSVPLPASPGYSWHRARFVSQLQTAGRAGVGATGGPRLPPFAPAPRTPLPGSAPRGTSGVTVPRPPAPAPAATSEERREEETPE